MTTFWNNLRLFLWFTFLTGIVYPLLITLIAQLTMKHKADGSFVIRDGKRKGSELIGQKFSGSKHFWSRPSATDYSALPSGASNLSPTSKKLKQLVEERKIPYKTTKPIPSDLLFASGSGLDPHISPQAAYFQVERLVTTTGLPAETLNHLIDKYTSHSLFGIFGDPHVNVLKLNLALDDFLREHKNEPRK